MLRGDALPPFPLFVSTAVDGITGFLLARNSDETARLLARYERTRPRFGLRLV